MRALDIILYQLPMRIPISKDYNIGPIAYIYALNGPGVATVHICGCIYPGISMTTAYVYQFCQPTYIQDIYRCLCQTYVGVHPPTYSQGEYSCIYLFHQNTYIQGFYHWPNGVVGTAYTRITEWFICIYLYPGFVQSVIVKTHGIYQIYHLDGD